ncbi:hypothetical protein K9N50_03840 [bacterium]|nr:hypothetical protein [bacterium]
MFHSNRSYSLITIGVLLLLAFVLQSSCQYLYAASSNITKVRCHMYDEGGKPVKVRLAIDFDGSPIKLNLVKSDDPYGKAPKGFIEDFLIVATNDADKDGIRKATISAGNSRGMLNVITESDQIRVAITEGYELQSARFNYLETVAYTDMKIIKRTVKPEPKKAPEPKPEPKPVVKDTTSAMVDTAAVKPKPIVEKTTPKVAPVPIVAPVPVPTPMVAATPVKTQVKPLAKAAKDTVYIEKIVYDTVFVEKIVYIEKGEKPNKLRYISAKYFDNLWSKPLFKLEFRFTRMAEKLTLSEQKRSLPNIPEGYTPHYVITQENSKAPEIFNNAIVKYARTSGKILIVQRNNKCYILAKDGYSLKATKAQYDDYNHIVTLRLLK